MCYSYIPGISDHCVIPIFQVYIWPLCYSYIPGIYLTIVMTLTSLSVIMTVFVLNLHHRGPSRMEVPRWLRYICLGKLQTLFCISNSKKYSTFLSPKESQFLRTMPLKVTLENIAQELQNEIQMENGMADTVITENQGTQIHREGRYGSTSSGRHYRPPLSRGHSGTSDEIIQSLKRILEKHEREDRDYEVVQEWRKVAQVVDRILFWIFFVGTLGSTLAVLVIAPSTKPWL